MPHRLTTRSVGFGDPASFEGNLCEEEKWR